MNTTKKSTFFVVAILLVLTLSVTLVPTALAQQAGTTLTATEPTAEAFWERIFGWTIDKTVTPETWNLFRGDAGTSQYTITVTKDAGADTAWIEGGFCVTNGGERPTENLQAVIELRLGASQNDPIIATAQVDVSSNPVLDPGETGCYTYRVDIPAGYVYAGGVYRVDANITITNHSGHLGEPFGPSPATTVTLPMSPTLINDSINVDDMNGGTWWFNQSGSVSYDKLFGCDGDAGQHNNRATIRETGQWDDASVMVNCYALNVSKDANTSLTRTYTWTIDKRADQAELILATGEQFLVNYSVEVGATFTDSDWAVNGTIWINNPAPIPATINGVSDALNGNGATVNCGVNFPYLLGAGGTLTCTYGIDLSQAGPVNGTNTATATLQNYSYDFTTNATMAGTTGFTGSADVNFGNATVTEVDKCANVSDDYAGFLGTVCYPDVPMTFTYSRWIGPYDTCGVYTVDNIASFVTEDTQASGSDGWTVTVNVPCAGCTLTPGYWKTHSKYGPAPYDATWALLGEDTPFFLSGQTYYEVLWTNPQGGNAYYILAHAYIAAKLNGLNGANTSAVTNELTDAESLLNMYSPDQVAALKGRDGRETREQFVSLADILDQYNNGYIGPGHCSE